MRGFLVLGGRIVSPINLDQHEARRIILLLEDIEARDTRFAEAGFGVLKRGRFETFDTFRFHMDVNVDD